jgi:hypothetical protein
MSDLTDRFFSPLGKEWCMYYFAILVFVFIFFILSIISEVIGLLNLKKFTFNEIYLLCENMDVCYNKVKDLMLKNGWINPMHTMVPGTDGQLSYGGFCFPKDTNALKELMKRQGTLHGVLDSAIQERNLLRDDNLNCLKK